MPDPALELADPRTYRLRVEIRIEAPDGAARNIVATGPIPMDWPEQKVRLLSEKISPHARVSEQVLPGQAALIKFTVPKIAQGEAAFVERMYEITRYRTKFKLPPDELELPRGTPPELRSQLAGFAPGVEIQNQKMIDLANMLVATSRDEGAWATAKSFWSWTRDNVKFENGDFRGAMHAIEQHCGDCEEMSALFVGLCRLSNIPARTVWVHSHDYPEFYLVDKQGHGHWIPAQVLGPAWFGEMAEYRPIFQKGDRFYDPLKKEYVRYVPQTVKGTDAKALPRVSFKHEILADTDINAPTYEQQTAGDSPLAPSRARRMRPARLDFGETCSAAIRSRNLARRAFDGRPVRSCCCCCLAVASQAALGGELTVDSEQQLVQRRAARLKELPPPPEPPKTGAGAFNEIDRFIVAKWPPAAAGEPQPKLCDDATFLRRVYLDVIGVIPTMLETNRFLAGRDSQEKRQQLVDDLLARDADYAAHWTSFWEDALASQNVLSQGGILTRGNYRDWLLSSFERNRPYDVMVAELIDPTMPGRKGAQTQDVLGTKFSIEYVRNEDHTVTLQTAANVGQVFLGTSMKCASCHDHFENEEWPQERFLAFAGLLAPADLEKIRCELKSGQTVAARFPFDLPGTPTEIPQDLDARLHLAAQLITDPANPRFAKTIVNRLWKRYFGLGLFEPADDFRLDTPASHPELLEWLAHDFVAHGCDLKHTIRLILTSGTYQLAYQGELADRFSPGEDSPRAIFARRPCGGSLPSSCWTAFAWRPAGSSSRHSEHFWIAVRHRFRGPWDGPLRATKSAPRGQTMSRSCRRSSCSTESNCTR